MFSVYKRNIDPQSKEITHSTFIREFTHREDAEKYIELEEAMQNGLMFKTRKYEIVADEPRH